jgi:hypothetical protein
MPPTSDPTQAFNELLATLTDKGATALVEDIRAELARGTLREIEVPRGKREEARRHYTPEEAYLLAAQMVLAALDPALMLHDVRDSLADIARHPVELVWRADYLESPIEDQKRLESIDQLHPLPEPAVDALRSAAVEVAEKISSLSKKE